MISLAHIDAAIKWLVFKIRHSSPGFSARLFVGGAEIAGLKRLILSTRLAGLRSGFRRFCSKSDSLLTARFGPRRVDGECREESSIGRSWRGSTKVRFLALSECPFLRKADIQA